jgi:hypothetical protein
MTPLPIAAIPVFSGERLTLNRGKVRPVLIVAKPGTTVEPAVRAGFPKKHYAPTYLVAPFYTGESTGTQAGYNQEFVRKTKRCEYTQFFWDRLPITHGHPGSILRFDQMQAVEPDVNSLQPTGWILSAEAQTVLNEMMTRYLSQTEFDPAGMAGLAVEEIRKGRPAVS